MEISVIVALCAGLLPVKDIPLTNIEDAASTVAQTIGVVPPPLSRVTLRRPIVEPYDPSADARADIEVAIERASASGRHIMVEYGANWCPDCVLLATAIAIPEFKQFMTDHYEMVYVDVGKFDKNLEILKDHGIDLKAIPTLMILDSEGQMINSRVFESTEWASGKATMQALEHFAKYAPVLPDDQPAD